MAPQSDADAKVGKFQGGLYPTVAVSDAFMAGCHYWAARSLWDAGQEPQALGFFVVAVAASAGVLRFGFSESMFARANEDLAALAGRVGLPLVGATLLPRLQLVPAAASGFTTPLSIAVALAVHGQIVGLFGKTGRELLQVLLNLAFFLGPLGVLASRRQDAVLAAGLGLFAVAGVVVGPERHRCIAGVRRENLFHYGLGTAAIIIATRLVALL